MIKHYEGYLGTFDYDDEEFEIYGYIRYIGKGLSVDLPKGCIETSYMFMGRILPEGFHLGDFDTSNVRYMDGMFNKCILPEGFTLGDKFDTSNVEDMSNMFYECKMPKGFSLGDHFDTSKVEDMRFMFANAIVPDGFSLGDHFDTSNVRDMRNMFDYCALYKDLLGDKFDTSNVRYMQNMFSHCVFPEGFSLGDKFNTSKVKNMDGMFSHCAFPEGMSEKSLLSKQKCLNNVYKTTLEKPYINISCFTMDCLNNDTILLPENIFNEDKPSEVKIIRYPAIGNYSLCKLKAEYILEPNSNKCCISPK